MAEIELSVLRRNTRRLDADWLFTTKDARIKLRSLYYTTEP